MFQVRPDAAKAIQRAIERAAAGPEYRRAGRVNVGQLKCNLGRVLDLSSGGVRLLSRHKLRGAHEIQLFDNDDGVRIKATVTWSKRQGMWKHEIGLEFLNVPSDVAAKLTALATKNLI